MEEKLKLILLKLDESLMNAILHNPSYQNAIICLTFDEAKLVLDYLNLNPDIGTKSEA
jgi:hypothetical protein